jgi:hypothetical protein
MARNANIIALRKAGVGPREIARRLNLTPSTVAGVLWRAGLTEVISGRGNGATEEFKKLAVAALADKSWMQVAREYGVSTAALSYWRKELLAHLEMRAAA